LAGGGEVADQADVAGVFIVVHEETEGSLTGTSGANDPVDLDALILLGHLGPIADSVSILLSDDRIIPSFSSLEEGLVLCGNRVVTIDRILGLSCLLCLDSRDDGKRYKYCLYVS